MDQPPASTRPFRVRRGNPYDHEALRQAALEAALALFRAGGLQAITMRGIAEKLGVTAMALYRYFPSKAALLQGLWEATMADVHTHIDEALLDADTSARLRLRVAIDVFLRYFEDRPDSYRLVFMSEAPDGDTAVGAAALASDVRLAEAVALEMGGDPLKAYLACDLRQAMCTGYLHSRLVHTPYPWSDMATLRSAMVEHTALAMERCLRWPGSAQD